MPGRINGRVKFFNKKKGYGFLMSEDKDYFVHISDIKSSGLEILNDDEKVSFEIENNNRGEKAVNIKLI